MLQTENQTILHSAGRFVYPAIKGPDTPVMGQPCFAFDKLDGTNLCFYWEREKGWYAAGTREQMITPEHPLLGEAWRLFGQHFAAPVPEILRRLKEYRHLDAIVACCELYGARSFAGRHEPGDAKKLALIDLYVPDFGEFMPPQDFLEHFGRLPVPRVVYQGPFNRQLIQDVFHNALGIREGVVVKGVKQRRGKGHALHEVWMAKIKTRFWLQALHKRAQAADGLYDYERELRELSSLHPQPRIKVPT